MNTLNTIILEGEISIGIPEKWDNEEKAEIFIKNEFGEFEIVIPGKNMVASVRYNGEKDRGIRIVGKLIEEDKRMKVLAEHIEFKLRKANTKKE